MSKLKTWEYMFYYFYQFLGDSSFQGFFLALSSLSDCLLMIYRPWRCQWDLGERVCLPRLPPLWLGHSAALCCLPARSTCSPWAPMPSSSPPLCWTEPSIPPQASSSLLSSPVLKLVIPSSLYPRCWLMSAGPEEDHLLSGLCYADVFLPLSSCSLTSLLAAMGWWSPRGHLWPSAPHSAHGAWGVCGTSGCCLCGFIVAQIITFLVFHLPPFTPPTNYTILSSVTSLLFLR